MVFQLQLSCILKQSILQQNSQRVNFDVVRNGKRPIAYHFFFFFSMKFEYKISMIDIPVPNDRDHQIKMCYS